MLISTRKLQRILLDENLVLIDARSFSDYIAGHIPGAVNLDLFSLHWIDSSKKGIQRFNSYMTHVFSIAGITKNSHVVFYDDTSGMLASRGLWLLQYFSHTNVELLDGGFQKWKTESRPIEKKSNGFKPSKFLAQPNPNLLVGFDYILSNLEHLEIIDARSELEYNGTILRAARGGHIPNAKNIEWKNNITKRGTFKTNSQLLKVYPIPKDKEIVVYCQGAYRAANSYVALKKAGFEDVKVYLGSWGEWGNKMNLPVV